MTGDARDREVEALLARYRPVAPDDDFRERVLASPAVATPRPPLLELAAGLLICAGLQWSTADTAQRAANALDGMRNTTGVEAPVIDPDVQRGETAWSLSALEPAATENGS